MNRRAMLRRRWESLAARERAGLTVAGLVVAVALLWAFALAPALRTVRQAQAISEQLDTELAHMQGLQAQARVVQAQAVVPAAVLVKELQSSVALLGAGATVQLQGAQALVTLQRVDAASLAAWLAAGGPNQHAHPDEVHLQRDADSSVAAWSGRMVFRLPPAELK